MKEDKPSLRRHGCIRIDNPDSSGVIIVDNGVVVKFPPLPGKDWQDRASKNLSEAGYSIRRRIAAEEAERS